MAIRIVGIGGGTGSLSILNLVDFGYDLTLISSVVDDGGSTGIIIESNPEILPPGDIRRMISNSARNQLFRDRLEQRIGTDNPIDPSSILRELVSYYGDEEFTHEVIEIFDEYGNEDALDTPLNIDNLRGHNLGNLMLAALMLAYGNCEGIERLSRMVDTSAEILPASENPSTFYFMTRSMTRPCNGENLLDDYDRHAEPIVNCWLDPEVQPYQLTKDRIEEADVVILTPTSLYANLVSFLLIPGYKEALKDKVIIWIGNIMTEWNQTAYSDYSLSGIGHLEILERYLGRYPDHAIVPKLKGQTIGQVFGAYEEEGASPVPYRARGFEERRIGYTEINMVEAVEITHKGVRKTVLRHNRNVLAEALDKVIKEYV